MCLHLSVAAFTRVRRDARFDLWPALSVPVNIVGNKLQSFCLQLHLAALTALKGEIIDVTDRLQRVQTEKELIERQLNRLQVGCFLVPPRC